MCWSFLSFLMDLMATESSDLPFQEENLLISLSTWLSFLTLSAFRAVVAGLPCVPAAGSSVVKLVVEVSVRVFFL